MEAPPSMDTVLAHVSPVTTQRYAHLEDDGFEQVLAVLPAPGLLQSGQASASQFGVFAGQMGAPDRIRTCDRRIRSLKVPRLRLP